MVGDAAAAVRQVRLGQAAPHRDRGGEGEHREHPDRDAPADDGARERDPEAADQPADDER